MCSIKYKYHSGFSLIELLIVIAIVGVMTSVFLVSFISSRDARAVRSIAREVSAAVRMAQSYALAGRYTDEQKIPCRFIFTPRGNRYDVRYVYHRPRQSCSLANMEVILTKSIRNGVRVTGGEVAFTVPHAALSGGGSATITISRGDAQQRICINAVGRITEQC